MRLRSAVVLLFFAVPLVTLTTVRAAGAATVVLSRGSGAAGTPVTATYSAPGCGGGVASTVAFSLDGIAGHQFGSTTLNPATCTAILTFPVSGSPGAHQIFGYVPNSGAPVASAPFTILASPPPTATPVSTPTPTPVPTSTPTPTPTPTLTPTASPIAQSSSLLGSLLVPILIGIILLLLIALVVLLLLLRRRRSADSPESQPPDSQPPANPPASSP
jgi:hypothetical protein